MWILKDSAEAETFLQVNKTFTIGRKTGDLVINDQSVSRNHAEINVTFKTVIIDNDRENEDVCKIKDLHSKYGTFLSRKNGSFTQLTENHETLQHLDRIRFGVQNAIYTVYHVPMITITSGLKSDEKEKLINIMDIIGGTVSAKLHKKCTYLTINGPSVTVKLACALAAGLHIATMEYWESLLKNFKANKKLPHPNDFMKDIANQFGLFGDISLSPNPLRKSIFKGLTFVHYELHQFAVFRRVIESAGGESTLHRTPEEIDVCKDGVIVVQMIESEATQGARIDDIYMITCKKLGKAGIRAIPSSEIGLAIIHCSTEKYCNPKYDFAKIFKKERKHKPFEDLVLAPETQESFLLPKKVKSRSNKTCDWIVPETNTDTFAAESQNIAPCQKTNFPKKCSDSQSFDPSMKILTLSDDHVDKMLRKQTQETEDENINSDVRDSCADLARIAGHKDKRPVIKTEPLVEQRARKAEFPKNNSTSKSDEDPVFKKRFIDSNAARLRSWLEEASTAPEVRYEDTENESDEESPIKMEATSRKRTRAELLGDRQQKRRHQIPKNDIENESDEESPIKMKAMSRKTTRAELLDDQRQNRRHQVPRSDIENEPDEESSIKMKTTSRKTTRAELLDDQQQRRRHQVPKNDIEDESDEGSSIKIKATSRKTTRAELLGDQQQKRRHQIPRDDIENESDEESPIKMKATSRKTTRAELLGDQQQKRKHQIPRDGIENESDEELPIKMKATSRKMTRAELLDDQQEKRRHRVPRNDIEDESDEEPKVRMNAVHAGTSYASSNQSPSRRFKAVEDSKKSWKIFRNREREKILSSTPSKPDSGPKKTSKKEDDLDSKSSRKKNILRENIHQSTNSTDSCVQGSRLFRKQQVIVNPRIGVVNVKREDSSSETLRTGRTVNKVPNTPQ